MDLRSLTDNSVKGEQKKEVMFTEEQIQRALAIYHGWQNEGTDGTDYAELYRSVGIDELRENAFSLVPSHYIEFVDRDRKTNYDEVLRYTTQVVQDLLLRQQANSDALRKALKHLGYDCE